MRVIVAPDKFGGGLAAHDVAAAIVDGLASHVSRNIVDTVAMSDGGEGFLHTIALAHDGELVCCDFDAWNGARESCDVWLASDGRLFIESANVLGRSVMRSSGASLREARSSSPLASLLTTVAHLGSREIVIGLGGTLCLDGGVGLMAGMPSGLETSVTVACDLDIRYAECAAVTGKTKGATDAEIGEITAELVARLPALSSAAGVDLDAMPFAGAGGGCAAALAAMGARLTSGASYVADAARLGELVASASCVITAEGRVDAMSTRGKLVGYLHGLSTGRDFRVFCRDLVDPQESIRSQCTKIGPGSEYSALVAAASSYALNHLEGINGFG